MTELTKLPIFFLSVESLINIYKKNEKIDIENIGVKLDSNVALSHILYSSRKVSTTPYAVFIKKESYEPNRKIILNYLIEKVIIEKSTLGRRTTTIHTIITNTMHFINWVDEHCKPFPKYIKDARVIFIEYTHFLKTNIRANKIKIRSAHTYQRQALHLLKYIFNDNKNIISSGINLIINKKSIGTQKSSENDRKYHFKFFYTFFHKVADFLLNKQKYPLQLQLPSSTVWVLPGVNTYIYSEKKAPVAFNFKTGKTKSIEDLIAKYKKRRLATSCLYSYNKNLDYHNQNFDTTRRLTLGSMALHAFYMLFISITGMNDSTAASLLWNDDYNIEKSSQRFRNIKYRAGNKIVEFEIRHNFINDFRKFLHLRKYLLGDNIINNLFFSGFRAKANNSKIYSDGGLSSSINKRVKKSIDPNLPIINSRQLRVNKTYQVIKSDGIIAASQISQSSIDTIISSYQGESFESCEKQFNNYFDSLNKHIFSINRDDIETSIGHCKNMNHPKSEIQFNNKNVDCSVHEGCLFCESYALHVDKQDLKKLYSLKYIIFESRHLAKDEEHFNKVYRTTLSRIDNIRKDCISSNRISENELKQIEFDVFTEENLHPYWEHKLTTLIKMGVIK